MNTDDPSTVPLASVAPGARLTAAVRGADGQVLMSAGSLLTATALQGLAVRGIVAVAVEVLHSEAEVDAARAALHLRLGYLFRRCNRDDAGGAAQMLFNAVLDRRLEDLQ